MRTNARVGRSIPKLGTEGPASVALAASVLLLVRLSAALRPAIDRPTANPHERTLGR